jgi:acetoin:2,6-dichlorophenolindophenol oxidoreductase subunit alpha
MHLFSPEHLVASSGIVGAAGPAVAGFALAAQLLRPGTVAAAFFGEAAMNQGMLMEALNLAAVWRLPVLFVCKDDGWGITTPRASMTAGDLSERVRAFDMPAADVDGLDVAAVWEAAGAALERGRTGQGPAFLRARCVHLEAHFLGFPLLKMVRSPVRELPRVALPLAAAFLHRRGAALPERIAGLHQSVALLAATRRDPRRDPGNDPVRRARRALAADASRLAVLEERVKGEVRDAVTLALAEAA